MWWDVAKWTALNRSAWTLRKQLSCESRVLNPPFIFTTHAHMWWRALGHAGVWGSEMSHLTNESPNIWNLFPTYPSNNTNWCFSSYGPLPFLSFLTLPASISVGIHEDISIIKMHANPRYLDGSEMKIRPSSIPKHPARTEWTLIHPIGDSSACWQTSWAREMKTPVKEVL